MPSAITKITLNRATFSNVPINELTFVNFFYGNNGAGKSSIAYAIEEDDGVVWGDGKSAADFDVLVEYYAKECPWVTATASQIPWALDDGIGSMLPIMQSDIMLTRGSEVLIIDAKYYTHTTQKQYDIHKIHSSNLYQIFTYVKNKDMEFGVQPHTVSGMLLYAATGEEIQPDNSYQMSGNKISVRTLNLNRNFSEIAAQLNAIVAEHFSGLSDHL